MNVCFLITQGTSDGGGGGRGGLAGCSIGGAGICGQGHAQSGSLKDELKTLS